MRKKLAQQYECEVWSRADVKELLADYQAGQSAYSLRNFAARISVCTFRFSIFSQLASL